MNKKNISITNSVFVASFVITILLYILINQNIERYKSSKINMPEDIIIYNLLENKDIKKLEKINHVKKIGLKEESKSAKIKDKTFKFTKYNTDYFNMQYDFLKSGEFPKNSNEILISEKTSKDLNLKENDSISITFGDRILKEEVVKADNNYLKNEKFNTLYNKNYIVSGIYNTFNERKIQEVFGFIDSDLEKYYPCIKLDKLSNVYEVEEEINNVLNRDSNIKSTIIKNESLINFFSIKEDGVNYLNVFINFILIPLIIMFVFIFMIKNIFNVWAIFKIKEYSMYKSIGATNFQIYLKLLKDSLKISILPLLLGEILGSIIMILVYTRLFRLQSEIYNINILKYSLNFYLIGIITAFLLLIIIISITFPARVVSKINIIDGIKGNIITKEYKKKRSANLFKELKLNNRRILRPQFIVMISGLIILEMLFFIEGINTYNNNYSEYEKDYNFTLRYSTKDNIYPKIFNDIKKDYGNEKSYSYIDKRFYVDSENIKYSDEFKRIGFYSGYEDIFYYPEKNLLEGKIIGIEDEKFKKLSDNKEDIILVNLVQKDPKEFFNDAKFIPFLDKSVDDLNIKYLENFKTQNIKIDEYIEQDVLNKSFYDLYNVLLITSIDNFQEIMKDAETEFNRNNMDMPRLYYNLNMNLEESEISNISNIINKIMDESLKSNESYSILNIEKDKEAEKVTRNAMIFLFLVILIAVVVLNIANSYSSINLSFFNRKNEIGILLSNGMEKRDLEKVLKKEMITGTLLSFLIATIVSIILILALIKTIPYVNLFKYIGLIRFNILIPLILVICISSYIVYIFTMKKTTKKEITELLKY